VIALGGNDALRGLPLDMTQANLTEMARAAKAAGAKVLIAGVAMPPTTGASTARTSSASSHRVARRGTALVPFLLAGVADAPNADELFQPDRIHPTAQAHPKMLDNVWPVLRPLLR